ncbi:Site-specific DNA recombinase [Cnuella takakiae]|uniref:Site-specific DNA recombinase n=1 Tax=Cnuella takakiae TaxID=1302690 RepID=A0A1M5JCD8_9BACT|nr:recombinase family protein [Cnuella takakiae]OLY95609.1 resolvase [Cnuella takakiae]SHG38035.1 Site-specific DNA recombinase [Cnuella takakiae]
MKKAIAYYRVSTDRQGQSGLGLEAQRAAVDRFVKQHGYQIIHEFTEIESGRKNNRPQLDLALRQCKKEKATLIIAKLDRLSRNLYFISGLIESGTEFKAVDMPDANKMMLQIHGVFAEYERDMISSRTKAALEAAKRRGKELGKNGKYVLSKQNKQEAKNFALQMKPIIEEIKSSGFKTYRSIMTELNNRKVPTSRNGQKWHYPTVYRLMQRLN